MAQYGRIGVYIDGLNLYNRRVKNTPYKWLNLRLMAETLLLGENVAYVRYFTTLVVTRPHEPTDDPDSELRQKEYIRALKTTAGFSDFYGLFREREKELRVVTPPPDRIWVYKTEEKGSDVNLASYLVLDACRNEFDTALVVSNDADLETPIEIARAELGKYVIVAIPGTRGQIRTSALPADRYVRILKECLKASQFPPALSDSDGTITKPSTW